MNKVTRYNRTAVILHWVVALAMIVNVMLALSVPYIEESKIRLAIDTHKSLGITVLGLALLRILWRLHHTPPAFPRAKPLWQKWTAHATHLSLYLPLSGWLHDSAWKDAATHPMYWFGLFEWPRISTISTVDPALKEQLHTVFGVIHEYLAYVLYALFVLHMAAALKHHMSERNPLKGRGMLPD